ncbi:MAG TPA: hypothetical protein VFQ58_03215 [Flavisolibacter sp.]|jgi:hypothetical protein|nr:hypothetical protein [Flavisolibacter sp.]
MERNLKNENFERFLRQHADSLRMRPNEKVWKEVSVHLGKSRRRFTILLSILLIISGGLAYELMNTKPIHQSSIKPVQNQPAQNLIHQLSRSGSGITTINQSSQLKKAIYKRIVTENISLNPFDEPTSDNTISVAEEKDFVPEIIDSYPVAAENSEKNVSSKNSVNRDITPLSIESVVNSYKGKSGKKMEWQLYFTPTVSYRKLSENKSYISSGVGNLSSYSPLYNINSAVTHKPDFGFEIGYTGKYKVSSNLKIKGGIQFNVNRYDIKVFNAPNQLATIRLNSRYVPDSLNAITTYSNLNGYHTDWLQNFYFQISAPIGVEFKIRGDDKIQFGLGTTIQPTYLLGDRIYLISTDYKNYAQVPLLVRRWNVNTSFESFVSYSTGHLKWQVGPQFRYQLLSSFIDKYPVKENLYNFGLKVGISLNQ